MKRKKLKPFQEVIQEYFDLKHAEPVPPEDLCRPPSEVYYMPMHAVIKESSTSTKLRVVFDASATTSSGVSLNDTLLIGPTVYPLLTNILMRFGMHKIVMTADITKMFRAIELDPMDRDLHRFVWRRTPQGEIKDYRMTRVTFGVTSSPFLATQTLQQIATNISVEYPEAAHALRNDFYVDDFIVGTPDVRQALKTQSQLQAVLTRHGLVLRKWRSNSKSVMAGIPPELHEKETDQEPYGQPHYLNTLGIRWNSHQDQFHISISQLTLPAVVTKRALTNDIAKTFDILGWFAPATITMKLLIQRLWEAKTDWDDQVPKEVQEEWTSWRDELPSLADQPIHRHHFRNDRGSRREVQLHGFSDASTKGYAAVVYLRATYSHGPPSVALVRAKTKVAPLKGLTVPRLELCGAQLLAELITTVMNALDVTIEDVQCWSDS